MACGEYPELIGQWTPENHRIDSYTVPVDLPKLVGGSIGFWFSVILLAQLTFPVDRSVGHIDLYKPIEATSPIPANQPTSTDQPTSTTQRSLRVAAAVLVTFFFLVRDAKSERTQWLWVLPNRFKVPKIHWDLYNYLYICMHMFHTAVGHKPVPLLITCHNHTK